MDAPKILITGATGYIGGSLLTHLLTTPQPSLKYAKYTVLLRTASQASLFASLNVTPLVLSNPDDLSEIRKLAAGFDIIVNPAYATSPGPSKALTQGLGDRLAANLNGFIPHIIQTSGTSNLSDRPHTNPSLFTSLGLPASPTSFTDLPTSQPAILETMRKLEAHEVYPQRTATLTVLDTAKEVGVRATVLMSPTIFGPGSGVGNKGSIQIPMLIKAVRRSGVARVVGEVEGDGAGKEEWDAISIGDLVGVYEGVLERVVKGEQVPVNEEGVMFTTTTRYSWRQLLTLIAKTGVKLGYLKEGTEGYVEGTELKEFTKWLGLEGMEGFVELGFASNARTEGGLVKGWGWKGSEGLEEGIERDWRMVAAGEGW